MRTLRNALFSAVTFVVLLASAPTAAAEPTTLAPPTDPRANPDSAGYSPVAFQQAWLPSVMDHEAWRAGDLAAGLAATGLANAEQFATFTDADQTQLAAAWSATDSPLLTRVWAGVDKSVQSGAASPEDFPPWDNPSSDWAATLLGGENYAALSPGLKSVVQKMATIMFGETKPVMPDEEWRQWMSPETAAAFDARVDQKFDWANSGAEYNGCIEVYYSGLCEAATVVVEAVEDAVDFFKDPLGWINEQIGTAATALMGWVTKEAAKATTPDLSQSWWIDAYQKSFGLGVLLMIIILIFQIVQKSAGKISSQDFMETIVVWVPGYFAGAIFGPPLAQFLINGSRLLAVNLSDWLGGASATEAASSTQGAIDGAVSGAIFGGPFVALILLLFIVIAGVFIFFSLCLQAVTIYLSGVVFGIAFAWVLSVRHRTGSMKIPYLIAGVTFSLPVLILLLGVGLGLTRSAIAADADTTLQNLAVLVMAVIVMSIASFTPLLLLKFAPVSPAGLGGAIGGANGSRPGSGQLSRGLKNFGSGTNGIARRNAARSASGAAARASAGLRTGGRASSGGGSGPGRSSAAAAAGSSAASGTSRAGRAGGGSVQEMLGRKPRHGGGKPSANAAFVAAAAKGRGAAMMRKSASVAGTATQAGRTASAAPRRVGADLADGVGGDRAW